MTKIIVLDDDPTGSQTVHSCLLLTRWDRDTLMQGLLDQSPIFFILTNTRALEPESAATVTQQVCRALQGVLAETGIRDFLVVSRSDSTLRGHYPVETDVIAAEMGGFDAHFLVPAFFEGGRFTRDSVHYLMVNGVPTPVHETEFARDSVFGYHHSFLPDYVAEKTSGRIGRDRVERFQLTDIRQGCVERLMALTGNTCAVVDGEVQSDLDRFAADILTAVGRGKRYLFRSAASWLTALAQLPPQPVSAATMASYRHSDHPGAILVGSHVRLTTEQVQDLVAAEVGKTIVTLEVPMTPDLADRAKQIQQQVLMGAIAAHEQGMTVLIYTSRQELTFASRSERLAFGQVVSQTLMAVIQGLPKTLGFLISKGGITSNDTLSAGLNLATARLLGQILPGVSVVTTPSDHPRFGAMPVVLFPGNVGDRTALTTVYRRLAGLTGVGSLV
ncbi:MAG: four-carbon acid sugar kinase family protein [Oscillatoriales cyanobacterium SM2_2_1]|nr:four-carbon acid sugar kinase family protein [Oscillatoriales cyanobacterium SM2_2_1]